jgi:hypothetical protein
MRPNRSGIGVPSRDQNIAMTRSASDGFDPDAILEHFVQLRSDAVNPLPLDCDIAGRRDEHPYLANILIVPHRVAPERSRSCTLR